jgi:hypothetical protein
MAASDIYNYDKALARMRKRKLTNQKLCEKSKEETQRKSNQDGKYLRTLAFRKRNACICL